MFPLIFTSAFYSGIQLSLVSELSASLVNAHASMTLGMDGISLVSFCSHSMFFQLCFQVKLNYFPLISERHHTDTVKV